MKHLLLTVLMAVSVCALQAQTLNVVTGDITTRFAADQASDMTYGNDGLTLTVGGTTFDVSNITRIYIDETPVADNAVSIGYDGGTARVTVSGNIARYVTATVSGAHVSIVQGEGIGDDTGKVKYTLTGNSPDGDFCLTGDYKMDLVLDGLTLTNPSGAAIDIENGKKINVTVKKGTVSTLTDGTGGQQKACIYIKGHAELKGQGTLNVGGRTAHAIKTGDEMTVKNLTLNITEAVNDGIHANAYFLMESGTLTVSNVGGDAIQAELDGTASTGVTTGHDDEDTGNIYIEGGTLTLTTTGAGTKCLKSEGTVSIADGTLTLTASGAIDTTDASDPAYVAGVKAAKFVQDGGSITMTVKGTAGRGVSADDIETNGGTLTIDNSAAPQTVASDVKSAKGLNGLNIALNAGDITITMTGAAGKGIKAGDGTKSTSGSSGGGWGGWGPGGGRPGGGGGGMGGGTTYTNLTGSYTQGTADGTGPTLKVTTTGAAYSSSSAKAIKAICAATIYGGQTEVLTKTSGAEGLESKTGIDIRGGQHYLQCYDDCINSKGKITFNGGVTVCYSNGNDAVDSNAGTAGAVTIGNGSVLAYTSKGGAEEGFDCDNNSYIQITGTGIGISAGGAQGGGSGSSTISNAKQGYTFVTSSLSYKAGTYYTLADAQGNNLVTYSFAANVSSSLALFTATGMVKGSTYNVKSSATAPTDATTEWHGLYLGSTAKGTSSFTTFTAK